MVLYSHSKLSTFEQCQLKFKFKYIDKLEPDIKESIETFLGHKVHETLQWIYEQVIKGKILQLDGVLQHFLINWNKDFNHEVKIIKKEYDAEYYFNNGVKFLINYFMQNSPFIDNTIALEKRIMVNLDNEGKYKLHGFIDRLVHNKETNILEIHDYKTNGFLKTQEELDKDRQLALYAIGIKDAFKDIADVHLVWHFLAFNKKIISKRTDEQLEQLKKEIIALINKIESTTEFPPSPSTLCKWCGFRSYCPLFASAVSFSSTESPE